MAFVSMRVDRLECLLCLGNHLCLSRPHGKDGSCRGKRETVL
ncbi:hypothetical protein HU200_037642 [Digitaria exilis]|uniref:Uncharacterized protein n=1 Tax=Digitaria exilis TaxID=1010633 RepID=A0A835BQH3_9POAL|nr:hypothetical protein HU200_037642 [Digitaria exilis]